jgi:hypothetical protein
METSAQTFTSRDGGLSSKVVVNKNSAKVAKASDASMALAIELLTMYAAREAKRLSSRLYPPASEPGEPPARRTPAVGLSDGILRTVKTTSMPGLHRGTFGTTVQYGIWLELGTSDGDLEARPFLRPALDKTMKDSGQILRKAFASKFK